MTSIYVIYAEAPIEPNFILCKHGMTTHNLSRPDDIIRMMLNALTEILKICGIPYSLKNINIELRHLKCENVEVARNIEQQLVSNRRRMIPNLQYDDRLYYSLVECHDIDGWNAHLCIQNVNNILDHMNDEFFAANEEELVAIRNYDLTVLETQIENEEAEVIEELDCTAHDYYNDMSIINEINNDITIHKCRTLYETL